MLIKNPLGPGLTIDPKIVLPKPINETDLEIAADLEAKGDLIITRKRDGYTAPITIAGNRPEDIRILTAGFIDTSERFPHLIEEVRSLELPPGTLLQGETFVEFGGRDSRQRFAKIAKRKPAGALAVQADTNEAGYAKLALFNLWQLNGISLVEAPMSERLERLLEILSKRQCEFTTLVEVLECSLAEAQARSKRETWEGLVLYDAVAPSRVRTDGQRDKIPRPYGSWKWKERLEDDFVLTGFRPSTAASWPGGVKDFPTAQYNQRTGEFVHCGNVGASLTKEQRLTLNDPSLYPMVARIGYNDRTESGKLIEATIEEIRDAEEKTPKQCVLPDKFC